MAMSFGVSAATPPIEDCGKEAKREAGAGDQREDRGEGRESGKRQQDQSKFPAMSVHLVRRGLDRAYPPIPRFGRDRRAGMRPQSILESLRSGEGKWYLNAFCRMHTAHEQ